MTQVERQFLIETLCEDLVPMIMEEYNLSDREALDKQLAVTGHEAWKKYAYHDAVLHDRLPQTIGGGIGQSRLCMLLLHKIHIGEVQASVWGEQIIAACQKNNINILQ